MEFSLRMDFTSVSDSKFLKNLHTYFGEVPPVRKLLPATGVWLKQLERGFGRNAKDSSAESASISDPCYAAAHAAATSTDAWGVATTA